MAAPPPITTGNLVEPPPPLGPVTISDDDDDDDDNEDEDEDEDSFSSMHDSDEISGDEDAFYGGFGRCFNCGKFPLHTS